MRSDQLRGIQHAFFEAMANGYAQGVQKDTIDDFPGSKVIAHDWGDYRVVDFYFTTPDSDKSTGQTIIWQKGVPVWTMHFGGRYAKIAIPFLKECLHRAYVEERRFYGGRGPYFVRGDRFTYVNQVRHESFADFEGEERIYDLSEQNLGHHWYRGMSLLKRD
jgi:hypothetical protein